MDQAHSSNPLTRLYVALVLLQAAHSAEEYLTRFYERIGEGSRLLNGVLPFFPVFQFSRGLFLLINVVLIATILTFIPVVNEGGLPGRLWATLVAVVELLNGVAHLALVVLTGGYFPGALTAPLLLVLSVLLLWRAWSAPRAGAGGRPRAERLRGGEGEGFIR